MRSLFYYLKRLLSVGSILIVSACSVVPAVTNPASATPSPSTATPLSLRLSPTLSPASPTAIALPAATPVATTTALLHQRVPITVSTTPVSVTAGTVHSLRLHDQKAERLVMDDTHLYWVLREERHRIYRYPLAGGEIELVAQTEFPDGELGLLSLRRSGDWLIFVDTPLSEQGITWKMHALNVRNNTDQVILEEKNEIYSWPGPCIDTDGDWLVWTQTQSSKTEDCVDTVLARLNLRTQESHDIERVCAETNWMWMFPQLSEDYLVVERDLPDNKGRGNDLYLYNFTTAQMLALTDNRESSMPGLAMPWIVWKAAPRFSFGPTALYNIETGEYRFIPVDYNDPFINGRWVYWKTDALTPLYVYDVEANQLLVVATPGENENIEARTIHGNMIAWSRDLEFEHTAPSDSLIEWRVLP